MDSNELAPLLDSDVELKLEELRIQAEAKRRLAAIESAGKYREISLTNEREIPPGTDYLIDQMMPYDGYVLVTGQKKVGKTTLMINVIKALTQKEKFLGEFSTHEKSRVALFDTEMSKRQHMLWLESAELLDERKLYTENLRGEARALGLFDDEMEERLVQKLIDQGIDVMVIDPLGPILRAYGIDENSNSEVGRVIDRLLTIKQAANVSGLLINQHQGKDGNLGARGASVLEDTPDAIWKLTRDDRTKRTTLAAFGRDVDETRDLEFDLESRTLNAVRPSGAYLNTDNRKLILDAIRANDAMSGRALFEQIKKVGYTRNLENLNDDLREMVERGDVTNTGTENRPKWSAN